ncbi:MAG: acyl-CoA dehydrogenase, partial [Alphaproteobacteria bacterium]|nr:acyl-CoA dehydrogenase [Alphaproteobacteria bacterium]
WATDAGFETASLGIQIHGGMGFIEETGAAQHLRDARITLIYEGTNGIQANDLLGRKLMRDRGAAAAAFTAEIRDTIERLAAAPGDDLAAIRRPLKSGVDALDKATAWLVETWARDVRLASAGAAPYLKLMGAVAGGWAMALAALAATSQLQRQGADSRFLQGKIATARFFAEHILAPAEALILPIMQGGASVLALAEDQL